MQCRLLGCAVEAWNEQGQPVIDEVGELVCTQPIPSMPLYFWGDARQPAAISSTYFDTYPGVWRHGDWLKITPSGGCIIYGRSDATINRHGLRMGTSELYSAVEALPEVLDSLVVDLEYLGRESYMPLFVVLRPGAVARRRRCRAKINNAIKTALSPRFVPERHLRRSPRSRARCRARSRSCRSRSCCWASRSRRWSTGRDGQPALPRLVCGFRAGSGRLRPPERTDRRLRQPSCVGTRSSGRGKPAPSPASAGGPAAARRCAAARSASAGSSGTSRPLLDGRARRRWP